MFGGADKRYTLVRVLNPIPCRIKGVKYAKA
jgi:hypothetical protein